MKKVLIATLILAVLMFGWCYHRRIFQDDRQRIIEIVEEMRLAAEGKSAEGITAHFSSSYRDKDGNTKFIITQLIKRNFKRVDDIRVEINDVDVTVTGGTAWASMDIIVEASKAGNIYYPFGSDQDPESPTLTFEKTGRGIWQITKVENVKRSNF